MIGSDAELGKPAGQDLAEGIYTLPTLLALADPVVGPELKPMLGQPLDQAERDRARSIVASSCGVPASVAVARRYCREGPAGSRGCGLPWPVNESDLAAGFARLAHLPGPDRTSQRLDGPSPFFSS